MGLIYGTKRLTSRCSDCGYFCHGTIDFCPQCKQLDLLSKQPNVNYPSASSKSLDSSIAGYAFGIFFLLGLVLFLIDLVVGLLKDMFRWIANFFNSLWDVAISPFVFVSNFTGMSVGLSAIVVFGVLGGLTLFGTNSNNNSKESKSAGTNRSRPAGRPRAAKVERIERNRRLKGESVFDEERPVRKSVVNQKKKIKKEEVVANKGAGSKNKSATQSRKVSGITELEKTKNLVKVHTTGKPTNKFSSATKKQK